MRRQSRAVPTARMLSSPARRIWLMVSSALNRDQTCLPERIQGVLDDDDGGNTKLERAAEAVDSSTSNFFAILRREEADVVTSSVASRSQSEGERDSDFVLSASSTSSSFDESETNSEASNHETACDRPISSEDSEASMIAGGSDTDELLSLAVLDASE